MRNSTATGTTATADTPGYRGRFAPSPTGQLHLGSLVTALGSFLDARHHGGRWLVRIEDLDSPREIPGAAAAIVATLARLGMHSDETELYQSQRRAAYAQAFDELAARGLVYGCTCSRSDLGGNPYAGTCRAAGHVAASLAQRFRLPDDATVTVADGLQGELSFDSASLGDPVIRRRDGIHAYQLAVVVDDAAQGITDVVRGADLLDSIPWQVWLQQALALPPVHYTHLPVLAEPDGAKLAKSRRSFPVDELQPGPALWEALTLLGQSPPADLRLAGVDDLLQWGIANWRLGPLAGRRQIRLRNENLGSGAGL